MRNDKSFHIGNSGREEIAEFLKLKRNIKKKFFFYLNKAIQIIALSNQPKISFNVPVNDSFSNVHAILIHECNASLINDLVAAGYSLSMTPKGLSVSKFKN